MNLHAVHHRQILIRSPAPHGEAAAEVIRRADAGQRLERLEDVVGRARHALQVSVLSIMAASPALAQKGLMGGLNIGTVSVSGETEGQQFKLQPGAVGGLFFGMPFKKSPNSSV